MLKSDFLGLFCRLRDPRPENAKIGRPYSSEPSELLEAESMHIYVMSALLEAESYIFAVFCAIRLIEFMCFGVY